MMSQEKENKPKFVNAYEYFESLGCEVIVTDHEDGTNFFIRDKFIKEKK